LTERDEFAYHEMIAHVPMFSHSNPKRVLIVGGGDGGILKQICRHECVESITMVEIDPTVIEVAKKYFSNSTAVSFDDPRLTIVHADALEYMQNTREKYDVIVGDALDPVGPGQTIFQPEFFESMYRALCHGGVACVQGDSIWINLDLISDVVACCNDIFDHAEYASITVPSVPCGQTGFILGRKGRHISCRTPLRLPLPKFSSHLKWYNPALHEAAFALPEFVKHHLGVKDDETDRCVVAGCTLL
jgi:spermidine synthase